MLDKYGKIGIELLRVLTELVEAVEDLGEKSGLIAIHYRLTELIEAIEDLKPLLRQLEESRHSGGITDER